VEELCVLYVDALGKGAISLYEASVSESMIFPNQDISAYVGPAALLGIPRKCRLYHAEPFGPLDTILVVDHLEELVSEMNVSNGALVSSIACDDPRIARRVASELRAFKVGINNVRSRGDREEVFGGIGQTGKGALSVDAILSSGLRQAPRAKSSSATSPTTPNSPKKLRPRLSPP